MPKEERVKQRRDIIRYTMILATLDFIYLD